MKKIVTKTTVALLLATVMLSTTSCGVILGGKISTCQATKPAEGKTKRAIRPAAFIADILTGFIPLIVDFATGAIYKPCKI